MPPVLPRFIWAPPVPPRFFPHSTPTAKISMPYLLTPISGVCKRVVSKKGGFGGCSVAPKTRNEGTFACSPGTKTGTRVLSHVPPGMRTGTRVHSPKPPFYETALLSPGDNHVRMYIANLASSKVYMMPQRILSIGRNAITVQSCCGVDFLSLLP